MIRIDRFEGIVKAVVVDSQETLPVMLYDRGMCHGIPLKRIIEISKLEMERKKREIKGFRDRVQGKGRRGHY